MRQLHLFDSEPEPPAQRAPDLVFIRKYLHHALRMVRAAEILPWSEGEAESWEARFPELAALLPSEEGANLVASFRAEIARLRIGGGKPPRHARL